MNVRTYGRTSVYLSVSRSVSVYVCTYVYCTIHMYRHIHARVLTVTDITHILDVYKISKSYVVIPVRK